MLYPRFRGLCLIGSLGLAGASLAAGPEASLEPSGFLANASQLKPGLADQAQLLYIDSEADFSSYQKVIVEPVAVWRGEGSAHVGVSAEELETFARTFEEKLRAQLGQAFEVIGEPAPGSLRLRAGIVSVRGSRSSPGAPLLGSVVIELELLDARSGRRLVAVADARGKGAEAADVALAFEEWAARARHRLAAFRDFDAAQRADAEASE